MSVAPTLVRTAVVLLLAATASRSLPGAETYWQQRACSADRRWCAEWVRPLADGGLEVRCVWKDARAAKPSDDGNRQLYLTDASGRRYDHVATTGAAAYGARPPASGSRHGAARGTFTFPAPAGRTTPSVLRDDANGLEIPALTLDPERRSSPDESRAVLADLLAAEHIEVRDGWGGLGKPYDRTLQLSRRADGGFEGRETAGAHELDRRRGEPYTPRSVRLTAEQARLFLETLADSALVDGEYQAHYDHTDDSPHLEIEIRSARASVKFSTDSQGTFHSPWQVRVRGLTQVVPSDHPGRALLFVRSVANGQADPGLLVETDERPRPLRMAAQRGDVPEVERLLARGAPIDERTPYDGETALTAAARAGRTEVVAVLLARGADAELPNAEGERALVVAAGAAHPAVAKLLARPRNRAGALRAAAESGSADSVRLVLAAGAVAPEEAGQALFEAAAWGSADMVRALIAGGAPVDFHQQNRGRPIDGAIAQGHLEVARLLVEAGASLRAPDWPALHHAANVGHADMVELLLRHGADARATSSDGRTALHLATVPGVAAALLAAGAEVDARGGPGAETPLIRLAGYLGGRQSFGERPRREPPPADGVGTARVLLDAGARVGATDAKGFTALQTACKEPLWEHAMPLAVLLLERGADPDAADPEGERPLWRALGVYAEFETASTPPRSEALLSALVKAGARDLPSRDGETTAGFAAKRRDPARLRAILAGLRK